MVGCALPSSVDRDGARVPEAAVLIWAVVEALEDLPAMPDAQREFQIARSAFKDVLHRCTTEEVPADPGVASSGGETARDVVVEINGVRNHGQYWSAHDLLRLRDLAGSVPTQVIGPRLGRTEQSIRSKASAEGISLKTDEECSRNDLCQEGGRS